MSNSPLICYTKISPNRTIGRNHVIDTVSIHCMAGQCSIEACGDMFADPDREASSQYGIGPDGRIGLYVPEKDRSWCTSNAENDHRAITIEVASDSKEPCKVTDAAYNSLIKLLVDICKRNNIKELKWKGDPSLIGQVDKQNMTVHRWFANKSCPGDYLYKRHGEIAATVNKLLGVSKVEKNDDKLYRVQVGAFKVKDNAENLVKSLKAAGFKDAFIVSENKETKKSDAEIAKEVLDGKWGNGQDRVNNLTNAGYDYNTIQRLVNQMLN